MLQMRRVKMVKKRAIHDTYLNFRLMSSACGINETIGLEWLVLMGQRQIEMRFRAGDWTVC